MCACKQNSSVKQVTSVKQVVKKPAETYSSENPAAKKVMTRRIVFRRHM
jgi:hypothetical protein